jgi:hypothetical protein
MAGIISHYIPQLNSTWINGTRENRLALRSKRSYIGYHMMTGAMMQILLDDMGGLTTTWEAYRRKETGGKIEITEYLEMKLVVFCNQSGNADNHQP